MIDALRKDILKSGIPLEIEVSQVFQKHSWKTANQFPYFDEKEKKIRAVDVVATKNIALVFECKKSTDHPWAFYTAPKSHPWPELIVKGGVIRTSKGAEVPPTTFPHSHILDAKIKAGMISYTPFGKKDDFFEAKNQVLNGLFYVSPKKEDGAPGFPTYPVIVFDGEMYEFYLDNGKLRIAPIVYLQFIASSPISRGDYLIDVLRKSYLLKFLEIVNHESEKQK